MAISSESVVQTFLKSVDTSAVADRPYRHWNLKNCLPDDVLKETIGLPFDAPDLGGVSGKRELHNNTRKYFDADNQRRYPSVKAVAEGLQDRRVCDRVARHFGTNLDGSYLRIEYAQDIDGFWLEPHTDLGVKVFTLLLYLSTDLSHKELGTDIYDGEKRHVARSPFASNSALVFVPSGNTYHGFEQRPIQGVRKSVIINYVTNEWRAREQLAFPESPIRA